ncbi:MAG: hypothetical protein R3F49_04430 [Planctomycetota bacterium]
MGSELRAVTDDVDQPEGIGALKKDLRAPWPDARRRAVKGLAALGTDEAWRLVMDALEDRDGQVADTAQLALAGLDRERLVRELIGARGLRHDDPWVRRRAADALGRIAAPLFDPDELIRAFDRREPDVTIAALWSLERLAVAGRVADERAKIVREVERETARGRAPRVRAHALLTLEALDSTLAGARAEALASDGEALVRAAALRLRLGRNGADGIEAFTRVLQRGLADSAPEVRAVGLACVAAAPTRSTLALVAQQLTREPRLALRIRTLDVLRTATGWKHGANPDAWAMALARLPDDWDGRPVVAREAPSSVGERSIATIGRLEPLSDRLAILIDFSGSLWNVQAEGKTRKELLDPEFRKLVGGLSKEARFNVVPFTGVPHPWQDGLISADPRRVKEAQDTYSRWSMRGQGDAFGAIEVALADPEVDRVLLLTDGAPTGGRRWDLPLMVELLLQAGRVRPVIFDVVLVDAPRGTARRWQRLTDETGGRLLAVSFSPPEGGAK